MFGFHPGAEVIIWQFVLSVLLLVIAVYELLGVIYVYASQRPIKLEYIMLVQSLISILLVGYLGVTVKVIDTIFNDDWTCLILSNLIWFGYLTLSAVIHVYYYMKQRVLSKAINTKQVFWWLRPLLVLCVFLIISTLLVGVSTVMPISKSYIYDRNICVACSTDGVTIIVMYMLMDFFCVVLLLILFILPLWMFIRENSDVNQSQPIRWTLIRSAVLCSIAVVTTIVAWVAIVLLGNNCTDIDKTISLSTQSFIWGVEQFVVCNCVLLTMANWRKFLLWPCALYCKSSTTICSSISKKKKPDPIQTNLLLSSVNG
jgi:hypothetical protein